MAQADQPGIADQQHQPNAGDGEDEHRAEFADIEFPQYVGNRQQDQQQQTVPEQVAAMAPQPDVLPVIGAEQISHGAYTRFPMLSANSPCGRRKSIASNTVFALTSWNPAGR